MVGLFCVLTLESGPCASFLLIPSSLPASAFPASLSSLSCSSTHLGVCPCWKSLQVSSTHTWLRSVQLDVDATWACRLGWESLRECLFYPQVTCPVRPGATSTPHFCFPKMTGSTLGLIECQYLHLFVPVLFFWDALRFWLLPKLWCILHFLLVYC